MEFRVNLILPPKTRRLSPSWGVKWSAEMEKENWLREAGQGQQGPVCLEQETFEAFCLTKSSKQPFPKFKIVRRERN